MKCTNTHRVALVVLGLIPKHGKLVYFCAAPYITVLSKWNFDQGFMTQMLHILVYLCLIEFELL